MTATTPRLRRLARLVLLCALPASAAAQGRDLVTSAVAAAANAAPGTSLAASDTVRNTGSLEAGASTTRFYLSRDAVRSADDVRMSAVRTVGTLGPGAESTGNTLLALSLATLPGEYRLIACADDLKVVVEDNEGNNCLATPGVVTISLADLTVTAISTPPATAAPGSLFTVGETVHNAAAVAAAASTTRYYLSLDDVKGASDILLVGTRSVPIIAPGASSAGTRSVTIPLGTPLGAYRVIACADDTARVPESADGNNCFASSSVVTLAWPDLVTTTVSLRSTKVVPGSSVVVTDSVANVGGASAAKSTSRYYLSLDGAKDASDLLLATTRLLSAIAPGGSSSGSRTLVIPAATPFASYAVLACADDLSQVPEADEANNCRAAATTLVVAPPNEIPRADAGADRDVSVGAVVQLDGLASSDGDGDTLSYTWTLLARPPASAAQLQGETTGQPILTIDVAGQYVAQLAVYDGKEWSTPDVVVVAVDAVRFAALGDTGFGDAGQYAGAAALAAKCARSGCGFAVLLGDNIYPSGVDSVSDTQFLSKFEAPYAGIDMPFYAVLGNHDYGNNGLGDEFHRGAYEVGYSAVSSKWRMPAAYYRTSIGPVELVGLDTNMQMYGQDAQQRADVSAWLTASTAPWVIALGHHPYRSNGTHGNAGAYDVTSGVPVTSGDGVKTFMQDVVCGRADVLLSGHDHNLQWLVPNAGCPGTELLVSGAGAKPKSLRPLGSAGYNPAYFETAQLGFAYIVATSAQLTIEFVGHDGRLLYVKSLTKAP